MVRGPAPVTRQGLPLVRRGERVGPSLVVAMTVAAVPLSSVFMQHTTREADHVIADALDPGMRALREAAFGGRTMERATGIEPALSAWEADVLPLNYARAAVAERRSA